MTFFKSFKVKVNVRVLLIPLIQEVLEQETISIFTTRVIVSLPFLLLSGQHHHEILTRLNPLLRGAIIQHETNNVLIGGREIGFKMR